VPDFLKGFEDARIDTDRGTIEGMPK
jgi:hypothetical protein